MSVAAARRLVNAVRYDMRLYRHLGVNRWAHIALRDRKMADEAEAADSPTAPLLMAQADRSEAELRVARREFAKLGPGAAVVSFYKDPP